MRELLEKAFAEAAKLPAQEQDALAAEILEAFGSLTRISVDEIERDVASYLQRVEAGETLIIVRAGKPVAEVKPIAAESPGLRPFGLCAGEFIVPDDFDDPLPEDVLVRFSGPRLAHPEQAADFALKIIEDAALTGL